MTWCKKYSAIHQTEICAIFETKVLTKEQKKKQICKK